MPGPMKEQRLTPRLAETARGLWGVYFVLSLGCFGAYRAGGMSWSDAFMHMCTTVGLGGLSSHDQSFGYWNSPQLEWTAVLFMGLAGISFARYFLMWRLRSLSPVLRDTEVRAYIGVLAGAVGLVAAMLLIEQVYDGAGDALRQAAFQVVSVATTTGYATTDYVLWPQFTHILLLLLMVVGACAGSTAGGMKVSRVVMLGKAGAREIGQAAAPRKVRLLKMDKKPVNEDR